MNTELVGKACLALGGGRDTKDSVIDLSVGIYLNKKTGEYVSEGDVVATLFASDEGKGQEARIILQKAYSFAENMSEKNRRIIKKIIL